MDMLTATKKRTDFRGLVGRRVLYAAMLAQAVGMAYAGDWTITPSVTVNETATDNVGLTADKHSDLVTDISPGISIEGSGGRSKLSLNYQLHDLIYAQDATRNQTQNSLNAMGTLEAVDNWLFIDASGVISQQNISAFGSSVSSSGGANDSGNTTETSTYRLSPYIKGSLGSFADYQLRYDVATSRSSSLSAFNSDSRSIVGSLKGETSYAQLLWSLDANSQRVDYSNNASNDSDQVRGVLTYQLSQQFRASLIGGMEANNYLTPDKKSYGTGGLGFDWAPTERTKVSMTRERRFFGDSNSINLEHRTAGSVWQYTDSRDVATQPSQQVGMGTIYEQFFNLYYASTCAAAADNTTRTSCANSLASAAVAALGVSPNAPGGFLSSGATLLHRHELTVSLLGARNTVTFFASRNESESLASGAGTGFFIGNSFSNAQNILQRVASVNWSHKLTPLTSLTGGYSRIDTETVGGGSGLDTRQQSYTVNLSTQLGPKTNAGLGLRHVTLDGSSTYTENAVTGVLSHQF